MNSSHFFRLPFFRREKRARELTRERRPFPPTMRSTGVASTSAPSMSTSSSSSPSQQQRAGWRSARRAPLAPTLRRRRPSSSSPMTMASSSFPDSNAAAPSSSSSSSASFAARATATKNKNPTLDEIVTAEALAVSDWTFVFFATRRRACGSTISAAALFFSLRSTALFFFCRIQRRQCVEKHLGSPRPWLIGTFQLEKEEKDDCDDDDEE